MRRTAALLVGTFAAVVLAAPSAVTAAEVSAPKNLRGFLLRVDEPLVHSFPRTPSFAWAPVRGALSYELQLSTSGVFRENGIVYSNSSLTTPVVAPDLTLPWITGEPHALYARVRAVLEDSTTPWSASFGFDVEPAKVPAPLPSSPGLIRWTPIDGATAYDVWFVDIPKIVRATTNVVDEREFYSFHQAASWLGQVRWRVRALRFDFNQRANGLPAAPAGPWSPVYSSVNPPFATGPLTPTETVSDVVTTGAASGPAHRLMPAYVFGGNQSFTGVAHELYRVHVYTDRRCVNRVYTGAIVGSPAYAPRSSGPLLLPRTSGDITSARATYLGDGSEGSTSLADGEVVTANEALPGVKPTTALPKGKVAAPVTTGTTGSGEKGSDASKATAPATPAKDAGGTVELLKASGTFGPPIDLWDTDWSNGGGYYWTVMPITTVVPGAAVTSVSAPVAAGATTVPVGNGTAFATGDTVSIGAGGTLESATVTGATPTAITVGAALKFAHGAGESVTRTNGSIVYRDAELGQDACAGGRIMRFGKESEPNLTSGGEVFATGLTPEGTLASADDDVEFYGAPLISWAPALGSSAYAVQWSKTRQPFKPETDPASGAVGMLTLNTSVVLPLETGTWYYRVRGYSFSLPTGSQALSWSDPQKIVVAKPEFKIVEAAPSEGEQIRVPAGGFSIRLPKSWSNGWRDAQDRSKSLSFLPLGPGALKLAALGGPQTALFVQSAPDEGVLSGSQWARQKMSELKAMPGRTGAASCSRVSLPAGASIRCALRVTVKGGTQASVVYALQHRDATYTLTFGSTPATVGSKRATFTTVARSLRFTS